MLKTMNKKMIIIIVAVAAVIIAGIVYMTTRPVTLDLHDYLECNYTGFDGNASASVYLDEGSLEEDIINAAVKKGKSEAFVCMSLLDDVIVDMKATPRKNLKNGDKIKITYMFNNKTLAKKYGVKFKSNKDSIKVEGLEEAKIVDVFSHLDLEFSGSAPAASTDSSVTVTIDGVDYICSISPNYGLDIGDELTIECKVNDPDIPVVPKESKTTMKVPDTISHYIFDPEELTVDDMGKFKNSLQVLLDSKEPFEDWLNSVDIYINSIADTGSDEHINSDDCTISNINITNEADFFAGMESRGPENKCILRYELDATVSGKTKVDIGTVFHCYGFCYVEEIIREDGKLTFDGARTFACSDLYTTETDRENEILEYDKDWNKLTKYSITLDGSKKPEMVREATNQYESN